MQFNIIPDKTIVHEFKGRFSIVRIFDQLRKSKTFSPGKDQPVPGSKEPNKKNSVEFLHLLQPFIFGNVQVCYLIQWQQI